jgi:hypothetical protein
MWGGKKALTTQKGKNFQGFASKISLSGKKKCFSPADTLKKVKNQTCAYILIDKFQFSTLTLESIINQQQ